MHYARGGTGAIIDAYERLLAELGVTIHTNAEVDEILVSGRKATGIRMADGTVHKADAVVSNGDVAWTYLNMIPEHARRFNSDSRIKGKNYSMSLFVIYFGTKRQYRHDSKLVHHNIILSERYKGCSARSSAPRGCPKISRSTCTCPPSRIRRWRRMAASRSTSCPQCRIWAPTSTGPRRLKPYRDAIMNFLEENYLPDLQENIVAEHYIDPLHFEGELNSYLGSAFSVQPTLLQSAWFRPHNRSEDFDNLYFVGAGTHPGAGVPGVISSAKIVDELIGAPKEATASARTEQPSAQQVTV
ncbi:MAG: FAD-dependent oxidoreductase [Caldilineaceae bacterium]